MTTGLEILERDDRLKGHWLLRIAAYLIDFAIIYLVLWVPSLILSRYFWVFTSAAGLTMFLYCSIMEASSGGTLGKLILGLRTTSFSGPLDIQKTVMRNISKVFPVLMLLDVIFGLATEGDPRQKYTDRISGTLVVEKQHLTPVSPEP